MLAHRVYTASALAIIALRELGFCLLSPDDAKSIRIYCFGLDELLECGRSGAEQLCLRSDPHRERSRNVVVYPLADSLYESGESRAVEGDRRVWLDRVVRRHRARAGAKAALTRDRIEAVSILVPILLLRLVEGAAWTSWIDGHRSRGGIRKIPPMALQEA